METKERNSQKLKINKKFVPCLVNEGDELYKNGYFVFNITTLIKYIHENLSDFIPEFIKIKEFTKEFSLLNENLVDSVAVSEPVIIAEITPDNYNLIDGNHRVEKARRLGIKSIMAYRLNVYQHIRFLTSKESYLAYIQYWNSKLQ